MERNNRICTESKETNGYDIAIIDGDGYTLYRGCRYCDIDVSEDNSEYILHTLIGSYLI